jgi:phospholipid-translocating ATPase
MEKQKIRNTFRHVSRKVKAKYMSNVIRNQKYYWYTLPFAVLLQQFEHFFNTFLVLIIATQLKREYSVSPFISSFGPWLVVLLFSIFKEGLDDFSRSARDKKTNSQLYYKLTEKGFAKVPSAQIEVGDFIMVDKNERVPADMVLIKTSDISGQVFIRTDQLDGETDWKLKLTVPQIQTCPLEDLQRISIIAEPPSKEIYSFSGRITIGDFDEEELADVGNEPVIEEGILEQIRAFLDFNFAENTVAYPEPLELKEIEWVRHSSSESPITSRMASPRPSSKEEHPSAAGEAGDNVPIKSTIMEEVPSQESSGAESKMPSDGQSVQSLDQENMIWMNTVIATCSVLGCIVYTGKETRAMLNTSKPRNKMGLIDIEFNNYMKFLGASCALAALVYTLCRDISWKMHIIFIRFLVLFSSVIPISLKVTVDMARIVYSRFIGNDLNIEGTIVRSSNLSEELGRVSYFLTDKTGTLTKNEMEMKKVHLGTICYTKDLNLEIAKSLMSVLNRKEDAKSVFSRGKKDINMRLYELVEALSVCHNVTPVISDNELTYQASSPDEVAIVRWTEVVGVKLYKRDRTSITILNPLEEEQEYQVLHIFPFTSESKRMGIIVKYNDEITFFVKGADVVMKRIIRNNDWVEEETDNMARDGLRTLVIAKKMLSDEEYGRFDSKYSKARLSIANRNEAVAAAIASIEKDMTVLGLTGVEDKLQDNVKVTLENLRNAGMKIWMLTGDKIETAISIAISSRIFSRNSTYMVISNVGSAQEIKSKLALLKGAEYNCLVIDGHSIGCVIDHCMQEFIEAASELDAVVGCRYSPTQKAIIARELKDRTGLRVCCIGDGGNDVSMITEANIGIGIVGKEGNQASLAADISINKFSYVCDLFFWHGRNCYKSSAKISHLIIHRGTVISVIQGIFCALIFFVPVSLYQGELIMAFVTLYTFFPIFSIVMSTDISRNVSIRFPELYKELSESKLLSFRNFFVWNLISFYQATVIMLIFFFFGQELFTISTLSFSSLIVNEQLMVALTVSKITPAMLLACSCSLGFYIITFYFAGDALRYEKPLYMFILKILGVNCIAILISLGQKLWSKYMNPPTYSRLEVLI